jgi:hypothetical protein
MGRPPPSSGEVAFSAADFAASEAAHCWGVRMSFNTSSHNISGLRSPALASAIAFTRYMSRALRFRVPGRSGNSSLSALPSKRLEGFAHVAHTQELETLGATNATKALPQIRVARVKPVESTPPNLRLSDDRIDLMGGFSLSSAQGIGGMWETPPHISPPDTFDERYGQW